MSWRPEVIADNSGKWTPNGLRFATKEEAEANARDLSSRWVSVRNWRVVESDEPVNYVYRDGRLIHYFAGVDATAPPPAGVPSE